MGLFGLIFTNIGAKNPRGTNGWKEDEWGRAFNAQPDAV